MATEKDALLSEYLEVAGLVRAHLEWEGQGVGLPDAQERHSNANLSAVHAPAMSADEVAERKVRLDLIASEVASCTKCELHRGRSRTVFARGNPNSEIAFVGEGPGYNEDQQGLPFVGAAGQLLDKMIAAMGYAVPDVYICNVVKCRPPDNRTPLQPEMDSCMPYLTEQLRIVKPRVIIALGRVAGQGLGCFTAESRGWRGEWKTWENVPVMPTYHPAFLLRSPEYKRVVWEDLQKVMSTLGKR